MTAAKDESTSTKTAREETRAATKLGVRAEKMDRDSRLADVPSDAVIPTSDAQSRHATGR